MDLSQNLEIATCTDPGMVRSHNEDSIAADPVTQEWWTHTEPLQKHFDDDVPPGEVWAPMAEAWHLD